MGQHRPANKAVVASELPPVDLLILLTSQLFSSQTLYSMEKHASSQLEKLSLTIVISHQSG